MPITQSWENPIAIWLLLFILLNFYLKTGSRIWRFFRAREIHQTLLPNEHLPSLRPLFWRIGLAMCIGFGLSCIGPYLSTASTAGQHYIMSLAIIIANGIAVNRYALILVDRYQLIPSKTRKNLEQNKRTSRFISSILHPGLGVALMSLLIIAIMGPLGAEKTTRLKRVPFQLAVVLDLSLSMDANDLKPSRLEHAKDELLNLLEQSTSDEISLIYFSDHAFIQAPLTVDHKTLQSFVRHASTDFMPSKGSDIGLALEKAAESFQKGQRSQAWKSRNQMQRIVLFTDGEDHGERLDAALETLKTQKTHVDVIGFGSDGGAQLLDPNGLPLLYKGEPIISHYNDEELERIARETEGLYIRYTKSEASIQALTAQYEAIRAEMKPSGELSSLYRVQLYPLFLYPAYALFLLLIIFPVNIFVRNAYRYCRKKHGKQLSTLLMVLACLGSSCDVALPYEDENNLEKLKLAISKGQYEKAKTILELAKSKASSVDFDALTVNEAILEIALGNCSGARQKLLAIRNRPHAQDLDLPIYLQLAEGAICEAQSDQDNRGIHYAYAIEQLYHASTLGADSAGRIAQVLALWIPNCTSFQDERLQKANTAATAIPWEDWKGLSKAVLCPKQALWIALPVREHENISMTASFEPLKREVWLDDSSKLPYSQISLSLYASDAQGMLGRAPLSTTSIPLPSGPIKAGDFKHIDKEVPAFTVGSQESLYLIKLESQNNGEASVYIELKRRLDCAKLDDLHTYTQALVQSPLLLSSDSAYPELLLCPKRPDVMLFELEPQRTALISLKYPGNKKPKLELQVNGQTEIIAEEPEDILKQRLISPTLIPDKEAANTHADHLRAEPWLLLFHNSEQNPQNYQLTINAEDEAIDYDLRFARSHGCKVLEGETKAIPLALPETLSSQKPVVMGPHWFCPNERLRFDPIYDEKDGPAVSLNIVTTLIAKVPLQNDAFSLSKKLRPATNDESSPMLVAEESELTQALWENADNIRQRRLSRPLTKQNIVCLKNNNIAGFYALVVLNQPKSTQSDNDKEDAQKKQQKNDGQSQEDDKTPQDKPSDKPDPQDKTNEPATPKGPGTDTKGDDSTPDAKAVNKNAAQFDPEAFERDKIDALLDDIERGNFLAPIEGMLPQERTSDKNW